MTRSKLTASLLVAAAAMPAASAAAPADLRSPDARDRATNGPTLRGDVPPVTHLERVRDSGGGFDWGDAGIGATAIVGAFAVAGGTFVVVGAHRRRYRSSVS
jgi:hypothetical protein